MNNERFLIGTEDLQSLLCAHVSQNALHIGLQVGKFLEHCLQIIREHVLGCIQSECRFRL